MKSRERGIQPARFLPGFLAVLALLLGSWVGTVQPAMAQSGTSDIAIVTSDNGASFFDACFILVGYSNEGCDENRDGKITFADIPYGTYTLQQTRGLSGGRYVSDTTIYVNGASDSDGYERFYVSVSGGSSGGGGFSDIAVVTTSNGSPFYDACFILVGYSNEGCDENRDGKITFEEIPVGTYTLRQTRSLGAGQSVSDSAIRVTGAADFDGWERFFVTVSGGGSGFSDVAVVTTSNGVPFYDACFVLVGYSNEGCDENRDGKITFEDIPLGTYTLRQTNSLGAGKSVSDSTFRVTGAADSDGWERFYVSVVESDVEAPVDIALITRDPADGTLLTDACYVLVGYSKEGCDENSDGQVTFAQIPPGTYTVRQTQTPADFRAINDYEITVENIDDIPLSFLVRQAPEQNAPGTRNVSIVFVDVATKTRLESDACVQFIGASNVGCDEDLRDGQVDFLDVSAGTWEYEFTNLPQGWVIDPEGADFGPMPPLVVDASPGKPSHLIRFIPVGVPASGGGQVGPIAVSATGPDGYLDGAKFTVTTQGGEFLGSCTLVDSGDPLIQACYVDVPLGTLVVVTLDAGSIPANLVPEENPIVFDTGSPVVASFWGVSFATIGSD